MRYAWGVCLAVVLSAGARADEFTLEPGYRSLFNGKDLSGWKYGRGKSPALDGKMTTPDGRFEVKDGIIIANEKDVNGKGGIKDLFTVEDFGKGFHLKLEFRASLKADSGVYLRGPQLQVRDFPRRGEHKHLKNFKNDDWNELDITVKDGVVSTSVNGRVLTPSDTLELTVKEGKPQAKLNDKEVDVKNVSVAVGAVANCLINGEPLEVMRNLPAKGGIGLQAETGKF